MNSTKKLLIWLKNTLNKDKNIKYLLINYKNPKDLEVNNLKNMKKKWPIFINNFKMLMTELVFNKEKLVVLKLKLLLWEINLPKQPLNMILKFKDFMANLSKELLNKELFKV